MRGILFTEYLDFAARHASEADIEEILSQLSGEIGGSYTAVGNYSFAEFAKIHVALASHLGKDPNQIAEEFGNILLERFAELFPQYFDGVTSGLDFLDQVGSHIHVEVKKLYPDARPPEVDLIKEKDGSFTLNYLSHRPLAPVARGLTNACLNHFGDKYKIVGEASDGNRTTFTLRMPS